MQEILSPGDPVRMQIAGDSESFRNDPPSWDSPPRLIPCVGLSLVLHLVVALLLPLHEEVQPREHVAPFSIQIVYSDPSFPPGPAIGPGALPNPEPPKKAEVGKGKPNPKPKARPIPVAEEKRPIEPPEPAGTEQSAPVSEIVMAGPGSGATEGSVTSGGSGTSGQGWGSGEGGGGTGTGGNGKAQSSHAELAEFWAMVRSRIEKNQQYPLWAHRNNLEGVVVVRFALTREGLVQQIGLDSSSGHRILDEAALQAVLRGVPYPPPPEGVPQQQLDGRIPVRFSIQDAP